MKVLLFVQILVLTAGSLFASGSNAGASGGSSGATPIRIFAGSGGRTWKADELNIQEIMRRTNTVLDVILAPGGESANQINLLFASNDLPDVINFANLEYQQYVSTGYLRPLDDLLNKYGQNILQNTSQAAWKVMMIQGKTYAYPYETNYVKLFTSIRSDWLENLGIDLSGHADFGKFGGKAITLDEYRDILVQFTRNDPDMNGKDDTYGLGAFQRKNNSGWANIYGAFGGIPGQYYITDGKAFPFVVTDQYRRALEYINGLWSEGVIDPEVYLANNDQAKQKMINGLSGSSIGEWWSLPSTVLIDGLAALNPNANFIPLSLTSNDGKIAGAPNNGLLTSSTCITTSSQNPEKVMEFLDFLNTREGWYLILMGIEGVDYTMVDGFPVRTPEGSDKRDKRFVMDSLLPFTNRLDLLNWDLAYQPVSNRLQETTQNWRFLSMDNDQPSYLSAFYGLPVPRENAEYGVDIDNLIEQRSMAFITGETPLNDTNWNDYINTWKRMGGVKILQAYITAYNNLNGTSVTAGITE